MERALHNSTVRTGHVPTKMTDVSLSKLIANVLDNTQLEGGGKRRRAHGGATDSGLQAGNVAAEAPAVPGVATSGPTGGAFDAINGLVDSTFSSFNNIAYSAPPSGGRSSCMLRGGEGQTPAVQASAAAALTLVEAGDAADVAGGEASDVEGGKKKLPTALKRFHAMAKARIPSLRKKHPSWNKFELWREANKEAGKAWRAQHGGSSKKKSSRRRRTSKRRSAGRR